MSEFNPDWKSPPGHSIEDRAIEQDLGQAKMAELLGITSSDYRDLIQGKMELTEEMCETLSEVLGSTKKFWMERERRYRARKC